MNAEDFYKLYKKGKKMENEYFIAVDKVTLFEMMEAYAEMKNSEKTVNSVDKVRNNNIVLNEIKHN